MNNKPSILIITFCIPWPVADGGKMYVYTSVNFLRQFYCITLLINVYNNADLEHVSYLRALWPNVKIEMVSYIKQLSAKQKIKRSITGFYYKNFSKRDATRQSHVFFNLRKKIGNIFLLSPNFLSKCEQLFAENTFDIVQVEYSTNIGSINFIPEKTITIYVEIESLHSIMEDFLAVSGEATFTNRYLVTAAKNIELDFMKRYDAIFALNQNDHSRLAALLQGQNFFTTPFAVPDAFFGQQHLLENWKPEKIIFLGSENHYPNKDGVEWYLKQILPLVKDNPLPLYITGAWSNAFKESCNHKNVFFTGFIDNLKEIMANSIMIVPIRLGGGGIRAKIIQAMAFGIPVVTTALACMGIAANNDKTMLVRNDEQEFADAVSLLTANREMGLGLIRASFAEAQSTYTEAAAGAVRHQIYSKLLQHYISE